MEKQSPVQRIWEPGKERHRKHIAAVLLAVVGVIGGMVPYFAAAKIIVLLIARVMLKDAPIVILDEVTANADPENEGRLQKAVEALTRDKTILMIAYRLRTVRNVDQILALDGGKIVQKGWHED